MKSRTAYSISSVVEKATSATFGLPLVVNVARGQLVEAMVALALEPRWTWCSTDYSGWDFVREDGLRLEVKQSAARQSWATSKPSTASFDVAARTGHWEGGTRWVAGHGRAAQIYVLAYHGIYSDEADHRDAYQWEFYVLAANELPDVKTIGLKRIQALADAVGIDELSDRVNSVAQALA